MTVNGTRCAVERELFRDQFVATSDMVYFGPYRAKIRFAASPLWHYVFSGFSQNQSDLENPFFGGKIQTATEKHKNEDGRSPTNEFWAFFPSANLYLVPISFWSLSGCWPFLGILGSGNFLSRLTGVSLVFEVFFFRQRWGTSVFALFA